MKASTLLSNVFGQRPGNKRRRKTKVHAPALERLEARQLLTAALAWDGDVLEITGSDSNDFIAVQQDELGLRVFTEDSVFTEFDGRSFNDALSIVVSGQSGNDILVAYETTVPVTLLGDAGNDVLYSSNSTDTMLGGEGYNWIQAGDFAETGDNAFSVPGLNLDPDALTTVPQFDDAGRIELQIDIDGEVDLAGNPVNLAGQAIVTKDGLDIEVSGQLDTWDDAFGIAELDLAATSLTLHAGTDVNSGNGYHVDLTSDLDVSGTSISVSAEVDVTEAITTAAFTGNVSDWENAFNIDGLDLADVALTGNGSVDAANNQDFSIAIAADLLVDDTSIEVAGAVAVAPDELDISLLGAIESWDNAFGVDGLNLRHSEVAVAAYSDRKDDRDLQINVLADVLFEDTAVEVSGQVDISPNQIDALFSGSVENWDDAFGIDGLDLQDSEFQIAASTDQQGGNELQIDVLGDLDIQGTEVGVSGVIDIDPDRVSGTLTGNVAAEWANAFGLEGLDLKNTDFAVTASSDQATGDSLDVNLTADLDVHGTDVAVAGQIALESGSVSGSLTGVVAGTWSAAFGIAGLELLDTTINVSGSKTAAGSDVSLEVASGINVLGTDIAINGAVEFAPTGLVTNFTGSVAGEWQDAFSIPGLNLKDLGLSFGSGSAANTASQSDALTIQLDTDLQLFGNYLPMIGDLAISPAGIDLSFSPPSSIGFTDLLGIPGFSLEDADLTVITGTDGFEVTIDSTMNLGNVDVDFTGAFAVAGNEVQASLTGRVAEWDDAFEVPGLDLDDVVLTLGAESGVGGASMFIGLGADIEIGSSELSVAGLVGFGATGWEVAFRGSIDSLTGEDLIDYANAINEAADPNAATIPDGALGDLELRTAFINFAPYGGNEALGIEDGFGIGGAFYDDGKLLGSGEFIVDLASGVFEVGLEIPELDLGPVELSDVLVDIRLASTDSHYHIAGTAELLGAEVSLEGRVSSNSFSLQGSAAVDLEGLAASVQFIVDQNGIRFEATAGGGVINSIKDHVTKDIRAVANVAKQAIDTAQAAVDAAERGVNRLEADLAEAKADAQEEVDKVKANIAKAKKVVDGARSTRDYWYNQRRSRYNAWRSAVAATRRAKWYQKAYYKGIEASRYSRYAYSVGRYSVQVGVYNTANAAYNTVRNAAGWVLDAAGVEANPDVLRIKGLLLVANTGLNAAELVLNGAETANNGVLQALNFADSLKVNRITIAGNISDYRNSGLKVTIDCSIGGRRHILSLNASPQNLTDQLGRELLTAIF